MDELAEIVETARELTGVPGVAAGLLRDGSVETCAAGAPVLGSGAAVRVNTPFRIASISKSFTAALALSCLEPDRRLSAWLSHSAGWRCESEAPLPAGAEGLWSYSNAGYWAAGREAARACGTSFEEAMRARMLEPLGLRATGFAEPARAARGHVQESEDGQRAVLEDAYPASRHPSGGLWSTVGDLLAYGAAQMDGDRAAFEPQIDALGARYALGWWVRDGAGGATVVEHEGSVAGYQSLLLLVPAERTALAVLTNSWRGSALIRLVVEELGLLPPQSAPEDGVDGRYALDGAEAVVEGSTVTETEVDPVTGTPKSTRYPVVPCATLMSHRVDFPREGLARIGWVVLPRTGS
jgi:CubicO group peptidase (beta-lactamase class C family)